MRPALLALASAAAAVLLLLQLSGAATAQSIIAMDVGSEYFKVVLVQPGKLFDVAMSPDSKRKSYTAVAVDVNNFRAFGSEAFNAYGKKPATCVWNVRDLLGRAKEHPFLTRTMPSRGLTHHTFTDPKPEDAGSVEFEVAGRNFAAEEVAAMLFTHAKEMSEVHGNTRVNSIALTARMGETQAQRQAIMDAAEIAGLTMLGLIDENGAAAVHFASERTFDDKEQRWLFINAGAGSTQISVISFTGGKQKSTGKDYRVVRVLSKAWDETLGSGELDVLLAREFAKEFDAKHPPKAGETSILDAPRAMVRLKKEARAIKEILSGLERYKTAFQSLYRDIDFPVEPTRAQLEKVMAESGFLTRFRGPIERALALSETDPAKLTGVEIIGGGVRIPSVREEIRKVLLSLGADPEKYGVDEGLSTHLNGDESMGFGAALFGANVSKNFRVPRIVQFEDALAREIKLRLYDQDKLNKSVTLWPRFANFETKELTTESIKFTSAGDFSLDLIYGAVPDETPREDSLIARYDVTGMATAMETLGSKFGTPKIHLDFALDRNMLVSILAAEARFEEEYQEEEPKKKAKANDSSAEATEEETAPKMVTKTRKHRFPLTVTRASVGVMPLTAQAKARGMKMLRDWDDHDREKATLDAARNALEAFSFNSKDKLRTNEKSVAQVTEEAELNQLFEDLTAIEDWIPDEIRKGGASVKDCEAKRAELAVRVDAVFRLVTELEERPEALKSLTSLMDSIEERIAANWTTERPWASGLLEKLSNALSESRADLKVKMAEQAKLSPKQAPTLSLKWIRGEVEKWQRWVEDVLKARKPREVPAKKAAAPPTTTASESTKDEETKPEDEVPAAEEEAKSEPDEASQEEKDEVKKGADHEEL